MNRENLRKFNRLRLLIWLFPLLVCILIYIMSAMPGEASSRLSDSHFMRKAAHIAEFTLLGVSLNTALYVSLIRGKKWVIFALFLTLIYAAGDELHQFFVPGRNASLTDVLIDLIGPLVLTFILLWLSRRRIS